MHAAEKKLIALTRRPHLSQLDRQSAANPFAHLQAFLIRLGNPAQKIPHYIQVTGTSGKGSTAAYLESILRAGKLKTGLTVSPHITSIYERWQVNGVPITPRTFNRLLKKLNTAFAQCVKADSKFGLSFFELCTALALVHFAEQNVEWAILEVFNGGRVDPTNIIPHKTAAIITNIGLDHQRLLGKTKLQIAREKSGIITPNCFVFTNENHRTLKNQITVAAKKRGARFVGVAKPQKIIITPKGTTFVLKGTRFTVRGIGAHQAQNAALAIAVTTRLNFSNTTIKRGLTKATLPLRFEITNLSPLIILDGAHNPDKIQTTVSTFKKIKPAGSLCLILSFSPTKNFKKMIPKLLTLKPDHIIITRAPDMPSMEPAKLARFFLNSKSTIQFISDPRQAWFKAQSFSTVLVTGSIYLASFLKTMVKK